MLSLNFIRYETLKPFPPIFNHKVPAIHDKPFFDTHLYSKTNDEPSGDYFTP
jgi:hypothetical protein